MSEIIKQYSKTTYHLLIDVFDMDVGKLGKILEYSDAEGTVYHIGDIIAIKEKTTGQYYRAVLCESEGFVFPYYEFGLFTYEIESIRKQQSYKLSKSYQNEIAKICNDLSIVEMH